MNKPDDTDLIHRCQNGDRKAFEVLLVRYEKPIFNAAYRMLGHTEDAQDITQSVFLKIYEHLNDYDPKYRFFSWIYRIAINESINCLNKQHRTESLAREPATQSSGPEETTSAGQQSQRIQSALMTIKQEYRTVIILKHFMECNYLEISQILNISEKKVKSRLYSGRQLLKDALQDSRRD